MGLRYPPVQTDDHVREIAGVSVPDPYHMLEDHEDAMVHDWALQQDALAGDYLSRETRADNYEAWLRSRSRPLPPVWRARRGNALFYFAATDDPERFQILREDGDARDVVLAPDEIEGSLNALLTNVSPSGRYLSWCAGAAGEPLARLYVKDLESGTVIARSAFLGIELQIAWAPDERGFWYGLSRALFEPGASPADGIYWHQLGDDWSQDRCVFAYPGAGHSGHTAIPRVSADGRWLLAQTHQFSSGHSGWWVAPLPGCLSGADVPHFVPLLPDVVAYNCLVGMRRSKLYLHTCIEAANGRIVEIDLEHADQANWVDLVPESALAIARPEQGISPPKHRLLDDSILVTCVEDACDVLYRYSINGGERQRLAVPELSTIDAIDHTGADPVVYTQSFLRQRGAWRLDADRLIAEPLLSSVPLLENAVLDQVFYAAADGTRVPMFLLRRNDIATDRPLPALLYAYGGFGQTITPEYRADAALWVQAGGVYALANIRGGGEYGAAWHEAARGANRQVAFDDFYAAAGYLIETGLTTPQQLAIKGISNGGLLSAVALNQRPELFAAVISEVPMVDMLWMYDSGIGGALSAEYGDINEPAVREVVMDYSPLQNLNADPHNPPQMIVVAEKDPSAQPGQIYKYTAARQALTGHDTPVLLRMIHGEGHTHWPWAIDCRIQAEEIAFAWHFANG